MMQAANLWQLNDPAEFGSLLRPWVWSIARQRQVTARPVVVLEIPRQDPEEMKLAQDDDVVQTFAAQRTDEPFHERVLPWGPRRRDHLLDTEDCPACAEPGRRRSVSVPHQESRRLSSGKACSNCRAVHSALGFAVTLKCSTRRRSWASTRNPNSTPNVAVGTVKKSIATRSFTWLSKNARQDGDDGLRCFTMYLATVDTATSMPSFASSLRMRGAPQVTFALDILRIRPTSSQSKLGRPPRPVRLLRIQKRLNPSRCHRTTVAGWTIAQGVPPRLPPPSQDHPESPVPAAEARASIPEGTGEDANLVAERQVF